MEVYQTASKLVPDSKEVTQKIHGLRNQINKQTKSAKLVSLFCGCGTFLKEGGSVWGVGGWVGESRYVGCGCACMFMAHVWVKVCVNVCVCLRVCV